MQYFPGGGGGGYFPIFQDKLHSFSIQDHRSTRGLLISETVQKISEITYTASRF